MNNNVTNVNYTRVPTNRRGYAEIVVSYRVDNKPYRQCVYIPKQNNFKNEDYLKAAQEQFNRGVQTHNIKGIKRVSLSHNPIFVTAFTIVGLGAIATGSFFVWKYLNPVNKTWKEVTKEDVFAIRDKIVPDITKFELPKQIKATYEEYILVNKTVDAPFQFLYDYDQMFYGSYDAVLEGQVPTGEARASYYVVKNNELYNLDYDSLTGEKIIRKFEGAAREKFDEVVLPNVRRSVLGIIAKEPITDYDGLENLILYAEMAKEQEKTDPEHAQGSVNYYSYDNKSLKVDAYAYMAQDSINYAEIDNSVTVEDGLVRKYISHMDGKRNGDAYKNHMDQEYQYNCKITIPEEADPDHWLD